MRKFLPSLLLFGALTLAAEEDVVLKKTSVSQYDEKGQEEVRISPQEARISGDRTSLKGVDIRTFKNGAEDLRIITPSCLIDKSFQNKNVPLHKGSSQEAVEISGPGFSITGLGFDFEFSSAPGPDGKKVDSRTFFIRDRVKSSWRGKEPSTKQKPEIKNDKPTSTPASTNSLPDKLDITAQNLTYYDTEKQAIFEHDVIIIQNDMIITCDRLTCFLEEDDKESGKKNQDSKPGTKRIRNAVAQGNIVIKRNKQICKCSDATYSLVDKTLKLTGNPVITEGRDTLQARRITILLPADDAKNDPKAAGEIILFDEPVIVAWGKLDLTKAPKTAKDAQVKPALKQP